MGCVCNFGHWTSRKSNARRSPSAETENRCRTRVSTLKDTSNLNLNTEAKLSYQVSDNAALYLRAQSETILRSSSRITENTIAAGVETRTGSYAELGVMDQRGNRKDIPDRPNFFTGKNDLQVVLKVGYKY